MPITATFDMGAFNPRNGYIVRDVDIEREGEFKRFANAIDSRDASIPFSVGTLMPGPDFAYILERLLLPSVVPSVKQVPIGPIEDSVRDVVRAGGFLESVTIGTRQSDEIVGGAGEDHILGWKGRDAINGGAGNDLLDGGAGPDKIFGGNGFDTLYGDRGSDRLVGGNGKDVLQGGAGSDRMIGGANADTFLFDDADFGGGRIARDRILDFSRAENDQIVDLTGNLEILAVGRIQAYGGQQGTLLQNKVTGDQVFLAGVELRASDIKTRYVEPPTPGPTVEIVPFKVKVEQVSVIDQGNARFATFKVSIENFTLMPITDLEDLSFRYRDAKQVAIPVLPTPNPSNNVSYRDGVFELDPLPNDGKRPPVLPGETRELFTFTYLLERGSDGQFPTVETTPADFRPAGFKPFDPNLPNELLDELKFELRITGQFVIDNPGGPPGSGILPTGPQIQATAEIFVKNTLDFPLTNIEDFEFDLGNRTVQVIGSPWGATFKDGVFDVGPWPSGDNHGSIAPNETMKVFGFTFRQPLNAGDSLTLDDFDILL